ncbi:hypothetical protein ACP4OV_019274 [Aristida adscensionis]
MAASAGAARLLRRRPPPPLPLFSGSYAEPRSPRLAAGGLGDVRRAQLTAPLVPPLLRRYSSKVCASRLPWQHRQGMQRPKQVITSVAAIPPASYSVQLPLLPVPSLIRQYSSKPGLLPPPKQQIDHHAKWRLKLLQLANFILVVLLWRMWSSYMEIKRLQEILKDLGKLLGMITEAWTAFEKAFCLLDEGFDDEASSVFYQGLDDCLKALALLQEVLLNFSKATEDCKMLSQDKLEQNRMFCKKLEDLSETIRKELKVLADIFESRRRF